MSIFQPVPYLYRFSMSCKISASGSPLKVVVWSTAESLGWQYGAASAARPIAPLLCLVLVLLQENSGPPPPSLFFCLSRLGVQNLPRPPPAVISSC